MFLYSSTNIFYLICIFFFKIVNNIYILSLSGGDKSMSEKNKNKNNNNNNNSDNNNR